MSKEAMKLALEALELHGQQYPHMVKGYCLDAITAIREALAEQPAQQEPVAIVSGYYGGQCVILPTNPARIFNSGTAFYTTPPASKPLTMQERTSIVRANTSFHDKNEIDAYGIIDDVEAAHGIKENT